MRLREWIQYTHLVGRSKVELIQEGYRFFKDEDVLSLFDLFDDDAEVADPFHNTFVQGREAVTQLWQRTQAAEHSITPGYIFEFGDTVVVLAHHDFYDRGKGLLGPGVDEMHRFTFQGDRIVKLEVATFGKVPEEVRDRLS